MSKRMTFKKYAVVGDYVVYGGPKGYSRDTVYLSNASLADCVLFVSKKTGKDVQGLNMVFSQEDTPGNMGCVHRYEIVEDFSPNTIWDNIDTDDKRNIIQFAIAWMSNEQASPDDLLYKIDFDDSRLDILK